MRNFLFVCALMVAMTASAQKDLLGEWHTVDDKTGEQRSIVTLYRGADGLYYGKIKQLLVGKRDAKCIECTGEDHNAPVEGMVIIRGMSYNAKDNQLEGGRVLDPESGKFYYGKIYTKNGRLVLRGSLDKRGFIGRNQTWVR